MSVSIYHLVLPSLLCVLATGVNAQDRTILGHLTFETDNSSTNLEVFRGPINGFVRSLASYDASPGGAGGMIMIEGHVSQVPSGANPKQGAAGIWLEFSAPAQVNEAIAAENLDLFYIGDWPAGRQEPLQVFRSAGGVGVTFERLQLHDGAAHAAGVAQGTLCPHNMDNDETQVDAQDCFEATLVFDSTLEPFAAPVRVADGQGSEARADDGPVTMTVLGSVTGILDGEAREWVTISGEINHEASSSANWRRTRISVPGFADTFGSMMGEMTGEDQAQLETLDQMFSGENGLADLIGQMTGEAVGGQEFLSVSISGHDPASPNILTERVLSLEISFNSMDAPLDVPVPAEISYFVDASGGFIPKLFYVSGDGGPEAHVTFTQLDLGPKGGHAQGSFKGTLCRMEGARLLDGPDLSACIDVEGQFDTELAESDPIEF